jgi:hypothetical protein
MSNIVLIITIEKTTDVSHKRMIHTKRRSIIVGPIVKRLAPLSPRSAADDLAPRGISSR